MGLRTRCAFFSLGGYPGDEDKARELFFPSWTRPNDPAKDFVARRPVSQASHPPTVTAKLGVVGLLLGAEESPTFSQHGLPRSGRRRCPFTVLPPGPRCGGERSRLPLLVHFGRETMIESTAAWPAYYEAGPSRPAGVKFEVFKYSRPLQHGFFTNDTTPRYDEARGQAWPGNAPSPSSNRHATRWSRRPPPPRSKDAKTVNRARCRAIRILGSVCVERLPLDPLNPWPP